MRYIENTCTLAILQILNEYRKIFRGSESTDLLEVFAIMPFENIRNYQNIHVIAVVSS